MPLAVPPQFAVECTCGTWARGARQPKPQVLTCAGCGRPVFVFPAAPSMFRSIAAPAVGPAGPSRVRFWVAPAVAAVLALAVVGMVIAAIVRSHRPPGTAPGPDVSEALAATALTERLAAARSALEEGSYRLARQE